ncbi:MAG TPA: VOC family protein [Anaeromyxobacteraceae bacterium]|nr:VOC family protein [Anaeromyxobacteraceae bacterium]
MIKNFDHVTLVVLDIEQAKRFFGLLGFVEDQAVVIRGEAMDRYMGIPGIEADHITLVLEGASLRCEVQLLRYHHPDPIPDPNITRLEKLGFNHVCFAVDDLAALVRKLTASGVQLRNEVMEFHDRKLVFLVGPEGITVELAEWGSRRLQDPDGRPI